MGLVGIAVAVYIYSAKRAMEKEAGNKERPVRRVLIEKFHYGWVKR